jgi:hypothetical protein
VSRFASRPPSVELDSKPLADTSVESRGRTTPRSCSKPAPALAIPAATTPPSSTACSGGNPTRRRSVLRPPRRSLLHSSPPTGHPGKPTTQRPLLGRCGGIDDFMRRVLETNPPRSRPAHPRARRAFRKDPSARRSASGTWVARPSVDDERSSSEPSLSRSSKTRTLELRPCPRPRCATNAEGGRCRRSGRWMRCFVTSPVGFFLGVRLRSTSGLWVVAGRAVPREDARRGPGAGLQRRPGTGGAARGSKGSRATRSGAASRSLWWARWFARPPSLLVAGAGDARQGDRLGRARTRPRGSADGGVLSLSRSPSHAGHRPPRPHEG